MADLRNANGTWAKGNSLRFQPGEARTAEAAAAGGRRRAEQLTPERRSQIARMGLDALAQKRFHGDRQAALEWMGQNGRWEYDRPYREQGLGIFPPPDPLPEAL